MQQAQLKANNSIICIIKLQSSNSFAALQIRNLFYRLHWHNGAAYNRTPKNFVCHFTLANPTVHDKVQFVGTLCKSMFVSLWVCGCVCGGVTLFCFDCQLFSPITPAVSCFFAAVWEKDSIFVTLYLSSSCWRFDSWNRVWRLISETPYLEQLPKIGSSPPGSFVWFSFGIKTSCLHYNFHFFFSPLSAPGRMQPGQRWGLLPAVHLHRGRGPGRCLQVWSKHIVFLWVFLLVLRVSTCLFVSVYVFMGN